MREFLQYARVHILFYVPDIAGSRGPFFSTRVGEGGKKGGKEEKGKGEEKREEKGEGGGTREKKRENFENKKCNSRIGNLSK